ncbi:MAG TPA: acyl-CoA dehydrogenase family protein [Burkholderiales bacterium]|nr:acyl-CoA dehydrogenase family protein [Burkholderiales bacterium]
MPADPPGAAAAAPAATTPSLLEAARRLAPLVRENADKIDADRELPKPVFHALADAGFYLMAVPRAVGGLEVDFPTYLQVLEELGKADASTAWTVSQGANWATYAARLSRKAAREIWIDTPRSVVSNTPAATAKAVAVPGGFRVTGRQPFSTGCMHASWMAAHAQVIENGEVRLRNGKPEVRYCLVPRAQVEIIDAWHTKGMRGTGTHTFEVKDVFVPEERTVFPYGAPIVSPGPRYKIPVTLAFGAGDGMIALGLARNCINAFLEVAGTKAPRNMHGLLRDQAISQSAVGHAEADLRSGRAYLMQAARQIWDEATSTDGPTVSLDSRTNLRLAATHAIHQAAKVVQSLYQLCGATVVFDGHVMQRLLADMNVITQHSQARLAHYEIVGKHSLGLEIDESRL